MARSTCHTPNRPLEPKPANTPTLSPQMLETWLFRSVLAAAPRSLAAGTHQSEGEYSRGRGRRQADNSAKGAADLLAVQSDPPRSRGLGRCDATTPGGY